MTRYGMVIDLDRCMGCRGCMEACKVENNTPQGSYFMYVFRFEQGEYPAARVSFMPRPCMHCDNAPCVKVCPVGARYKREDGLVATDWDRCIGCRYCEVACPYGVNTFNWKDPKENQYLDWSDQDVATAGQGFVPPYANPELSEAYGPEERKIAGGGHVQGVMEKCTFCVHRVEKGLDPACVQTCPVRALSFGDLDDPDSPASRELEARSGFRLLEDVGTEPRVHYVGGTAPSPEAREVDAPLAEV
jgi:molybdopterin-containing oxidoreductase family iron-sulfur binding subunit